MNMNEIATAAESRQLIQIVMNNHVLGMVRQWQTLFYEKRYSSTVLNDAVDFVKLAEALGAKAIRVTKMEDVEPALKMAVLAAEGPVVSGLLDRSGSECVPDGTGWCEIGP